MTTDAMVKVLRYKADHIKAKIKPEFFGEVADRLEELSKQQEGNKNDGHREVR